MQVIYIILHIHSDAMLEDSNRPGFWCFLSFLEQFIHISYHPAHSAKHLLVCPTKERHEHEYMMASYSHPFTSLATDFIYSVTVWLYSS